MKIYPNYMVTLAIVNIYPNKTQQNMQDTSFTAEIHVKKILPVNINKSALLKVNVI